MFELFHVKDAPIGVLLKATLLTLPPHCEMLAGTAMVGIGFTEIRYVSLVPVQPFKVGVNVIVAVATLVPELVAVKEGTFPVPLAVKPIAVLELVHV